MPQEPIPTRATLLRLIRDSADESAWRRFEGTYHQMILRYCRSRGMQYADSEDLVQVVFSRLVTGLRRFEYDPTRGRFRDYLFRCVRSAIADQRRQGSPDARVATGSLPDERTSGSIETSPDVFALFEQEWVAHHYRVAIAGLRISTEPRTMEVFEELLGGLSVADAARALRLTEAAVYKIQQRMRARLRERIAQQVRDEDALAI